MKMSKLFPIALLMVGSVLVTACDGDDPVPQAIVDQNMVTSKNNAEMNAKAFRNERFPEAERVLVDSDSTIGKSCRFGDGWASGQLVMPSGERLSIKCQTTGRGKGSNGCLTNKDFVTKSYAGEEGSCNHDLTELPKFK